MKNLLTMIIALCVVACASNPDASASLTPEQSQRAASLNVQLGVDYMRKENYALAEKKLQKALALAPNSSLPHWTYALLQERLGYTDKADANFKKAIRLNKNDAEAFNAYGAFLCRNQRVEEALSAFESAANNPLYNGRVDANNNAANCLMENQRFTEAKPWLDKALDLDADSAKTTYLLSKLYYHQGKFLQSSSLRNRLSPEARDNPGVLWLCIMTERAVGNRAEEANCTKLLLQRYPASDEAELI